MKISESSIKLTSKHQLTVPARVVRKLRLSAGDRLAYELRDGALILRPRPTVAQQLGGLWADNAKANRGVASDASIAGTLKDYYRAQGKRS